MEIYLLRHAVAVDQNPGILRDEDRSLTKKGAEQMRQGAQGIVRLGLRFDRILTSPLLRAFQTAEIVAEALHAGDMVETVEELGFGFSCEAVCNRLARADAGSRVLLVGHEPDLGMLAGCLIAGRSIPLKKGSLCFIETQGVPEPANGALQWLLWPKHLRAIGDVGP